MNYAERLESVLVLPYFSVSAFGSRRSNFSNSFSKRNAIFSRSCFVLTDSIDFIDYTLNHRC